MSTHPAKDTDTDLIILTEDETGQRLDKILAQRFTNVHSRTYFQKLIEDHCVLVNGSPVKKRFQPQAGDEIEIQFVITPEIDLTPENIPLDIVYEDDDLIAINKPSGMVVHPATGNWSGTFVNALLFHCKNLLQTGLGDPLRPGIVHRLDKDTSGILIAAKTSKAQQRLIELFSSRKVYKEYLAICLGNPGNRTVDAPIGRHPIHRQQMKVIEGGKPAVSIIQSIAHDEKLSLVQVIIETGRTHQIRVHLKHCGTPVLGDTLYGNPQANAKYGVQRQLLHAYKLRLPHPISGKTLDLTAPIPKDMEEWVAKLNRQQLP